MSPRSLFIRARPGRRFAAVLLAVLCIASVVSVAKRSNFQPSLLRQAFAADAGFAASVPPEVVDARALVRAQPQDLSPLSLGLGLKDDALLQQRMWEALYPVRFSATDTPHRLLKASDPLLAQCQVIDRRGDVVLANCL